MHVLAVRCVTEDRDVVWSNTVIPEEKIEETAYLVGRVVGVLLQAEEADRNWVTDSELIEDDSELDPHNMYDGLLRMEDVGAFMEYTPLCVSSVTRVELYNVSSTTKYL